MKVTVLGCGALGQLWLAGFFHQKHIVQGWLRVQKQFCTVNVINTYGVESHLLLPANNIQLLADSELLLVTLKAWQVSKTVQELLPQLRSDCAILLIHNGLGTHEELPKLVQPLLLGITTHAAYAKNGKIYHISVGITRIGPGNVPAQSIYKLSVVLQQVLPKVTWHNNIVTFSWIKLAVNCVINPLSAIHECCNGELEYYADEIEAICREVAIVMNHESYHINYQRLLFYVYQVIKSTSQNISSMLQDIRAKRHSEIDYINGYVLRRANAHGLMLPVNQQLFDIIKYKEQNYQY